jgi:hypothetical protein
MFGDWLQLQPPVGVRITPPSGDASASAPASTIAGSGPMHALVHAHPPSNGSLHSATFVHGFAADAQPSPATH